MSLPWSAAAGWRQARQLESVDEILTLAQRLVDRTATLYEHLGKLGRSVGEATKHYGALVGSVEGSLLVTVRDFQALG
jgi:DNA recombination protein RmuC